MRGAPDFGGMRPMGVMATMADVGELAARLGSRCVYDRRGNVYYWDDFEGMVKRFKSAATGAGVDAAFNSDYCISGSQSILLDSGGIGTSDMELWVPVLGSKHLGLEVAIGLEGYKDFVKLFYYYNAGETRRYGAVRIRTNPIEVLTRDIQIAKSDGTWVDIATEVFIPTLDYGFNHIKLVCDFDSGYYTRLLFNANQYEISEYALHASPYPRTERTAMVIRAEGTTGVGGIKAWVDDVLFTCEEP